MGLFSKLFNKKEVEVKQERVKVVQNQDERIENCSFEKVEDHVYKMFDDPDQFVTLSLTNSSISYVQACLVHGEVVVQVGNKEKGRIKLVEKRCTKKECLDIFFEFYDKGTVQHLEDYAFVDYFG